MRGRKRPASGGGLRQRLPPDGILRRPAPDDILPQSPVPPLAPTCPSGRHSAAAAPDGILPQSPVPPSDGMLRQPRPPPCFGRRFAAAPASRRHSAAACPGWHPAAEPCPALGRHVAAAWSPPPCFGRHSAAAARPGRHPAAGPPPSGPVRPERGQTCAQELRPLRRWAEKTRESSFAALFSQALWAYQ